MGTTELKTKRLRLRKYKEDDAKPLFQHFGCNEKMYAYSGWNPYETEEMAKATVQQFIDSYQDEHFYGWAIECDGELIGTAGAYDYQSSSKSIEIGISIKEDCWGKGYATEALTRVLGYLTREEGIKTITAWCASDNAASMQAMKNAGMKQTGMEDAALNINGKLYDKLLFSFSTRSSMWNPWRGCKKCSDGCLHCYIHKGDAKRGVDTSNIVKTKDFDKPLEKWKNGSYKMKAGTVYLCFSTDFLIEEADEWRPACWSMIKARQDCMFLFLTKRIERFMDCVPDDWGSGYENVVVCCTIENQKHADRKLSIFQTLPIKHKCITAQPLLEKIDIEKYLQGIELVVVGGESDHYARPLDYDWVLNLREQCIRKQVNFEFRQLGTHFIKDGKKYKLKTKDLCSQAKKADIDVKFNR